MLPPSLADIDRLARAAWDTLPEAVRAAAAGVAVHVEDWPDEATLEEMDLDAYELTGLYEGTPLTEASVSDQPLVPPAIRLFRRPILDEWAERELPLADLVAHILVHELAHHLGWSDEDIAAIDPWWED